MNRPGIQRRGFLIAAAATLPQAGPARKARRARCRQTTRHRKVLGLYENSYSLSRLHYRTRPVSRANLGAWTANAQRETSRVRSPRDCWKNCAARVRSRSGQHLRQNAATTKQALQANRKSDLSGQACRVFRFRLARAAIPSAPRPTSSIAHVAGSGTLEPVAIAPPGV